MLNMDLTLINATDLKVGNVVAGDAVVTAIRETPKRLYITIKPEGRPAYEYPQPKTSRMFIVTGS